jgi:N4-gp56 family major capsid protein
MALNTVSVLSGELIAYLEKRFLERSRAAIVFAEGAQKSAIPANTGKTITWNRYTPAAVAGALTEGTNPASTSVTAAQVSATIVQYGQVWSISDLLFATSIDREAKEKTDLAAQNMSETLDQLVRDELFAGGTVQFANAKTALTALASSDVLNSTEVRKARRALKKNNAIPYSDGYFLGKVGPDTSYDIMNDSVWLAAKEYSTPEDLYKGEVGRLFNVRFIEATSNQKTEASTVTVFSNFFHGQQAIGTVDLDSMPNGLIVKQGGDQDTSNALNLFITIGWKAAFVAKTLNPNWIYNVKTGASA